MDASIQGSETAGGLAGSAVIAFGQPRDPADVVNELRETGKVEDFGRRESMSLVRPRELGVYAAMVIKEEDLSANTGRELSATGHWWTC